MECAEGEALFRGRAGGAAFTRVKARMEGRGRRPVPGRDPRDLRRFGCLGGARWEVFILEVEIIVGAVVLEVEDAGSAVADEARMRGFMAGWRGKGGERWAGGCCAPFN